MAAKGLDKIGPLLVRIAADAQLPELAKEMFGTLGADYAGSSCGFAASQRGWVPGSGATRRAGARWRSPASARSAPPCW